MALTERMLGWWYARNGFYRIAQILGYNSETAAGIIVNEANAMTCSVPLVCTKVITETLAMLPLPVLQRTGDMTVPQRKLPLWDVLNRRANGFQTAYNFRRLVTHYALNYGDGHAEVIRESDSPDSQVVAMVPLHPRTFSRMDIERGDPVYIFNVNGQEKVLKSYQCLHLMNYSDDGLEGKGAVELGAQSIAQLMAIERYGSTFFARGGVVSGILKKLVPFRSKEDRETFQEDFAKKYEGQQGFHKKLLVEGDWDFKPFGTNPAESQMAEARAAMVPDIARFYNLTPHLAGDLSRAHFNNVEHLWIEFLNVTQMPWMIQWEEEIFRVCLTPRQQAAGMFVKHNVAQFLRGDLEARFKAYAMMLQNGVASINEIRALEDWDPVDGGDAHHIQLNMQTVPGTGEETASQLATLMRVSEGRRRDGNGS